MSFPVQHDNIVTPFSHLLETTFFKTSKGFKKIMSGVLLM